MLSKVLNTIFLLRNSIQEFTKVHNMILNNKNSNVFVVTCYIALNDLMYIYLSIRHLFVNYGLLFKSWR